MKLSLIVPCYNEEKNIELFYSKIQKELAEYWEETEIIFINDGSNDLTLDILKKVYKKNQNRIKIVDFSRNFGKEAALIAGLQKSKGEFTGIIDADMQQNPKYIKDMINFLEINKEYDGVAAYQDKRDENKILKFCKFMFYKIMQSLTDIDIFHSASDFRVFRRKIVDAITSLPERCRFSKGIFSWIGFRIHYIPYKVEKRATGKSKWTFWKLFFYALDGVTAFSTKPLIISALLGIIFCFISVIFMTIIVTKTLIFGDPVAGYPTLATIILFASGIQLFFLGVLGQYLAKNYTESKQRPFYIVKNVIESQNSDK